MSRLTPVQIQTGIKRNVTDLGPKPVTEPPKGRWRCHLCPFPAWQTGTYDDWKDHYRTHQEAP